MDASLIAMGAIMAGGALGGLARAWLGTWIGGVWGLLAVNATGSFALGVLAAQAAPDSALWLFCATGVVGAYTTVSSFALMTLRLWNDGARGRAVANVAGSTGLALGGAALGLWLGAA